MTTRFIDKNGLSVEPAILDKGEGGVACFIVRDKNGFSLVRREEPEPRTPEELEALGVDLASLEVVC